MSYKYEIKNCKNCMHCAKTVNGIYCLHREGQPKVTNGGWCIDWQDKKGEENDQIIGRRKNK